MSKKKKSFYELYKQFYDIGINEEYSIAYGYLRYLENKDRPIPKCLEKMSFIDKLTVSISEKIPGMSELAKTIGRLYSDNEYRKKVYENYVLRTRNNTNLKMENF